MHLLPKQEQALRKLLHVFLEENTKLNLSAYREPEQCWVGNILDSIPAYALLRTSSFALRASADKSAGRAANLPLKIVDIGTGGGFPLLPLALLLPEIQFTGLDATRKKVDAMQRMVAKLTLENVQLLTGRAEELGHDPKLREQFDLVLCRAVAELSVLLEYCSPFARVGGKVIAWKTLVIEEELQASVTARMQLHCRLMERVQYDLDGLTKGLPVPHQSFAAAQDGAGHRIFGLADRPTDSSSSRIHLWGQRQLLVFEKVKTLSREFPRKIGMPKKKPL